MQERKLRNGTISLYTSIKQLPIVRYNQMNHFLAQEMGLGDDMSAVTRHLARLDVHLRAGDVPAAQQERINLGYNVALMLERIDIKSRVFLAFVHSIDGHPVGDLDDDNECDRALAALSAIGATVGDVEDIFEELKKKLMPS